VRSDGTKAREEAGKEIQRKASEELESRNN